MARYDTKKQEITKLLLSGSGYDAIVKSAHCSSSTITILLNKLREQGLMPPRRKFKLEDSEWVQIQEFYDSGKDGKETKAEFGLTRTQWYAAIGEGKMKVRPQSPQDVAELTHRGSVKKRLIKAGILEDKCGECGLTHWRGEKISLHVHHKNGQSGDHRPENIALLCPNCHSITDTYAGRNKGSSLIPGAKIRKDRAPR